MGWASGTFFAVESTTFTEVVMFLIIGLTAQNSVLLVSNAARKS